MTPRVLASLVPQLSPDLGQRGTLHLGEADLQHDLLGRTHGQQVHDLAGCIGRSDLDRLVGVDRVADHAFQHDRVICHSRGNLGGRKQLRKLALQGGDVRTDDDIDHRNQVAGTVVKREAGRAGLLPEHIDRRAVDRHDVGDVRIADQHLGIRPVGSKDLALVDRHVELAGIDVRRDTDLRSRRRGDSERRKRGSGDECALDSHHHHPPTVTCSLLVP